MKLLLIDHPYRKKTNSIDFLKRVLEKRFDVTTYYETTSHVDYPGDIGSFDAVALFQIGVGDIGRRIRHRNVIFFPMYDNVGSGDEHTWKSIGDTKVVSFCRQLFNDMSSFGTRALYVQYYPSVDSPSDARNPNNGVFFWQRTDAITWPLVKLLLGNHSFSSVHIHAAVDPNCTFIEPPPVEKAAYRITCSTWFESREGFWSAVGANRYFVSPRVTEGIGLSFLEAMAMGKVVLAANRPTMNEYIVDGENGLLFEPNNPTMIDFSRAETISKNVKDSIADGQARWKRYAEELLDFMMPANMTAGLSRRKSAARRYSLRYSAKAAVLFAARIVRWLLPHGVVLAWEKRGHS